MTEPEAARLYLVTPPVVDEAFVGLLEIALAAAPIACLRLDLGPAAEDAWRRAANLLLPPCHAAEIPLLIADHARLVAPLGLDGVHLGQPRAQIRALRRELGPDRVIGAFAGASRHDAMSAAEAGADYVSLGPVGDTGRLGDGARAEPDLFAWWAEMIETPVVAEGAVGPSEAEALAGTADFIVPDLRLWSDPAALVETLGAYARALA